MGYAGYTAAKLPPPKATGVQAALWSIDNMECLEVCHQTCTILTFPSMSGCLPRFSRQPFFLIIGCQCRFVTIHIVVQVMSKLVRNTAVSPSEDKFKRIKLSNSKVKSTIVEPTGGVPSLLAMGWVYDEADQDFLMLPKGVQMTMKEVSAASISTCTFMTEAHGQMVVQQHHLHHHLQHHLPHHLQLLYCQATMHVTELIPNVGASN